MSRLGANRTRRDGENDMNDPEQTVRIAHAWRARNGYGLCFRRHRINDVGFDKLCFIVA